MGEHEVFDVTTDPVPPPKTAVTVKKEKASARPIFQVPTGVGEIITIPSDDEMTREDQEQEKAKMAKMALAKRRDFLKSKSDEAERRRWQIWLERRDIFCSLATNLGAVQSLMSELCLDQPLPPLPHLAYATLKFFDLTGRPSVEATEEIKGILLSGSTWEEKAASLCEVDWVKKKLAARAGGGQGHPW